MAVTRIKLRAPGGRQIALGRFSATGADRATVVAPVTGVMAPGTYLYGGVGDRGRGWSRGGWDLHVYRRAGRSAEPGPAAVTAPLAMNGADEMMHSSRVAAIMVGTKWGLSWLTQLGATLVALYGFNLARHVGAAVARGSHLNSVLSYLAARRRASLSAPRGSKSPRDWWGARSRFALYSSRVVLDEAMRSDPAAAARRLVLLAKVPLLD